jgi:hypothetical protein
MEQFFPPTRRLRNEWEATHEEPFEYAEVQLAVPAEQLQICPLNSPDFCAYATGASDGGTHKIVWITEHTLIVVVDPVHNRRHDNILSTCGYRPYLVARLTPALSGEQQLLSVWKRQGSDVTAAHSFFWRMVATSNSAELTVAAWSDGDDWDDDGSGLTAGPVLAQFLGGTPRLQTIYFGNLTFEEQHCRALSSVVRTDLEINLTNCRIESIYLLDILGENSCIKKLAFDPFKDGSDEEHIVSLAQVLPSNNSILKLQLFNFEVSDETWDLLFHSMSTHPRLEVVRIGNTTDRPSNLSDESKTSRMRAIVRMLQRNTVVHTIDLPDNVRDDKIFQNSIQPRLEMNRSRFELQRGAIAQADPSIRSQLLGRALSVVQSDPSLVYGFLTDNVQVCAM